MWPAVTLSLPSLRVGDQSCCQDLLPQSSPHIDLMTSEDTMLHILAGGQL